MIVIWLNIPLDVVWGKLFTAQHTHRRVTRYSNVLPWITLSHLLEVDVVVVMAGRCWLCQGPAETELSTDWPRLLWWRSGGALLTTTVSGQLPSSVTRRSPGPHILLITTPVQASLPSHWPRHDYPEAGVVVGLAGPGGGSVGDGRAGVGGAGATQQQLGCFISSLDLIWQCQDSHLPAHDRTRTVQYSSQHLAISYVNWSH